MSARTIVLSSLAAFAFLLFAGAAAAAEPGPAELRRLVAERAAVLRLQTDFPSEPVRDGRGDYAPQSGSAGGGAAVSSGTASGMLWIALGVFVAVLLVSAYDSFSSRRAKGGAKRGAGADRAELIQRRMDAVRLEGDALAAEGDYAGAMHALLLRSVEEMRAKLRAPIAISLTSREILGKTRLEPEARAHFGDIIHMVEISWFGAHSPGAADYSRCRASFIALAAVLGRGGAA